MLLLLDTKYGFLLMKESCSWKQKKASALTKKIILVFYMQKIAYLFFNVNNPIFRYEYKLFNGYLYSNVGKVCLWSLYHHCLRLALYVVEHDSKLYGSSHKISCVE